MRRPAFLLALALCLPLGLPASTPAHAADSAAREEAGSTRNLYMLLIRQARTDGRPRAALAYLADFDRQHPGDIEARILRINCLLDLGQTDAAQAALSALPANGANGEIATIRGHVLAAQGAWPQAIAQYRTALAESPANPLTGNALGYAQLRAGQSGEALETFRAAADLAPKNPVIRNNLLLAMILAGRSGEAEALLRKVPDDAARTTLRAQLAGEARRIALASTALVTAVDAPGAR